MLGEDVCLAQRPADHLHPDGLVVASAVEVRQLVADLACHFGRLDELFVDAALAEQLELFFALEHKPVLRRLSQPRLRSAFACCLCACPR